MGKFIVGSFAIMAWVFYILSGGANFQPETRIATMGVPQQDGSLAADVVAVTQPVAAQPAPDLPAATKVEPAIMDAAPVSDAIPVAASTQTAPAFDGTLTTAGTIEPMFTSLAAPAPAGVGSPDLTALRAVAGRAVNMREGPSTSFNVIDTLPQGTQTEVIESDGTGWVRVRVVSTGQTGWMAERLLTDG